MKLIRELHAQVWTISGVLLVLITLSGATFKQARLIFIVSLVLHFAGALFVSDDDSDNIEDT